MTLTSAPDDPANSLFHRLISENGLVEVGVYPVLFGHRVRAGFIGYGWSMLDWCGGGRWADVERLYSLAVAILSKRDEDASCFDGLPTHSAVKPFFLDREFVHRVGRAAGNFEVHRLEPLRATPIQF